MKGRWRFARRWPNGINGASGSRWTQPVMSLIGSKEGIGHLPLAYINPGDAVLVPDPGYPVYHAGTVFAGGESVVMPLHASNGFLGFATHRARACTAS